MVVQKLGQIQLLLDNMPSLAWMKNRNVQYLIINRLFEQFGIKNGILRLSLAGYTFLGQHNRLSVNYPAELAQAQVMIAEFLAQHAPTCVVLFEVAINEAVNNGLVASERIQVKLKRTGSRIVVRVKDNGTGFSTKQVNALGVKDVDNEFEQLGLSERGRGIMMMKMFCDQIIYNAQGNEVLLMKKI